MATFTVTTSLDENDAGASVAAPGGDGLSLREAIALANETSGHDTIVFASGMGEEFENGGLIRLDMGELVITNSVTINGSGAGGEIVITGDANNDDVTLAGTDITDVSASRTALLADNSRVFNITSASADTTLEGITITGGRTSEAFGSASYGSGGGVYSAADLTLTDTIINGNSTSYSAGTGGGVHVSGDTTITGSTISNNSTSEFNASGGGVYSAGVTMITDSVISGNSTAGLTSSGGGIFSNDILTITNSTITGNTTTGNNAVGGGILADNTATITNSTISNNSTTGGFTEGGGINLGNGTLTITNSTISGNSSSFTGGGIASRDTGDVTITGATISGNSSGGGGGVFTAGETSLINSTVSGNSATGGGGGFLHAGQLTVTNSILLGNATSQDPDDAEIISSTGVSPIFEGLNIIGADSTIFDAQTISNVINADPDAVFANTQANASDPGILAGVLADNGGPVQTIALNAGVDNPALDVGTAPMGVTTDANGNARDVDLALVDNGGTVDLGAVELAETSNTAPRIDGPIDLVNTDNITDDEFQGPILLSTPTAVTTAEVNGTTFVFVTALF